MSIRIALLLSTLTTLVRKKHELLFEDVRTLSIELLFLDLHSQTAKWNCYNVQIKMFAAKAAFRVIIETFVLSRQQNNYIAGMSSNGH